MDHADLVSGFRSQLQSLVAGSTGPDDLHGWLADHVNEVATSEDRRFDELVGVAWGLLAEYQVRDRSLDELLKGAGDILARLETQTAA